MQARFNVMQIGEVGLLTDDVVRLANFYKALFGIENNSDDTIHQVIIADGTGLAVYNDGRTREGNYNNMCIAFTVDNVDAEYERLKLLGVNIVEPPTDRSWGARNMIFKDPDGNEVIFRSGRRTLFK